MEAGRALFGWREAYLLIGGAALILLGITMLGDGLRRAMGGRMRWAFTVVARNRLSALLAGAALSGPLQSSGPAAAVLMGLADAGVVTAGRSAAIILGAMVGGTIIPQLLAFQAAEWGLLAVAAGFGLILFGRWQSWKSCGWALAGFGLMFYGVSLMTKGASPLGREPELLAGLTGNPLAGAAAGMLLTAMIQSSGAAVALVMSLAAAGAVEPANCLPLVVGINLGACSTAMLAAAGAGREGRRVAFAYLGFKLLGTALVLPVAFLLGPLVAKLTIAAGGSAARAVVNMHTAYNLALALVFILPSERLAALFDRLLPARPTEAEKLARQLSGALSAAPSAALLAAGRGLADMGRRTVLMLRQGLGALEEGGSRQVEDLKRRDDQVDAIYVALSASLSRLPAAGMSAVESRRQARLLYVAKLFEEIGDLVSRDLARLAAKRASGDLEFSMESLAALRRFGSGAAEDLERVAELADRESAPELAELAASGGRVEEEHRRLVAAHFEQLRRGVTEAGETGSIYPDALAVLRDVRRATAEIARVLATGEQEGGAGAPASANGRPTP